MKRRLFAVILVFILILGLAGCQEKTPVNSSDTEVDKQEDVQTEPEKEETEELPVITVGVCKTLDALPLFFMQEEGIDREQGFMLQVEQFDTYEGQNTALQNGELDGVLTDSAAVFASLGQGTELRIIGPADSVVCLLAGPEADVTGLSECYGKMVCMPENTGMEYILDFILAQNNYVDTYVDKSKADAYLTVLSILEEEPDLLVLLPEPYASMARQQGATMLASSSDYGLTSFVTAFRQECLSEKESLAGAFSTAYQQAVTELAGRDVTELLSLFSAKTGLAQQSLEGVTLPEYRLSQIPSEEDLEDVYYWSMSKEVYEGEFNLSDVVYFTEE